MSEVQATESTRHSVAPAVDIFESDTEFLLRVDLPGVSQDNLILEVEDERLRIEGSWSLIDDDPSGLHEYSEVDFQRSFKVPAGVDQEKISASWNGGTLHIHLPLKESQQPRSIPIH